MTWLEAARRIVDRKGAEFMRPDGSWTTDWPEPLDEWEETLPERDRRKIPEGTFLDLFTASMLVQVHDALGPENQERYAGMDLLRAVDVGWKLAAGNAR